MVNCVQTATIEDMIYKGKPYIFRFLDKHVYLKIKQEKTEEDRFYIEESIKTLNGEDYGCKCYHTDGFIYQLNLLKQSHFHKLINTGYYDNTETDLY